MRINLTLYIKLLVNKPQNLTFPCKIHFGQKQNETFANETVRIARAISCETTAVAQTSACRHWHRRGFSRPCSTAVTLVHQGRWATGGQLNSGHLLLQDDQTDGYVSACWTSAAQLQPTALCFHTNAHSWSLLGTTNVQGRAGYSSGRRMR